MGLAVNIVAKTIKGFFFDLDGTLVNTHESNFRAYREAIMDVVGVSVGDELSTYIKAGESSKNFLPKLLPHVTGAELSDIIHAKERHYPKHLGVSQLNEYLSTFLQQMSNHYVTVLVTTAKRNNALAVLKQHNFDTFFTYVIFGDDVVKMKPEPDAYMLALEKTQLTADDVIAFEDSANGIAAAHAAGIQTIQIKDFM